MAKTWASGAGQGLIRALPNKVWPEARGPKPLAALVGPLPEGGRALQLAARLHKPTGLRGPRNHRHHWSISFHPERQPSGYRTKARRRAPAPAAPAKAKLRPREQPTAAPVGGKAGRPEEAEAVGTPRAARRFPGNAKRKSP
jgi:hypothetical protein